MLAPTDRRLLLDALAPPPGYSLDHAIGTTYTLDLVALLRVPLAATTLPWSGPSGGPTANPFALLAALRRNASRISLYCHAGATKVPARHVPLLAFLEGVVHPVTPPTRHGVFHPKLWLLRFVADDEPVRYRLVVLSRNLTFDRSWDVALVLDGELTDRRRSIKENHPLAEFIAALPTMAAAAGHAVPPPAAQRAQLLSDEARRVAWEPPEGFDTITFHPIGHDGKPHWPVTNLYRLMVLSPFVGAEALERLRAQAREEMWLVGRFDELSKLDREILEIPAHVAVFDDPSVLLDIEDDPDALPADGTEVNELSGLHAKVFAGERHRKAVVFVGSANATGAAFEHNVEFLVELEGARTEHGVDRLWKTLTEAGLLTELKGAGEATEEDVELLALERRLERVAHELAAGALRGTVEALQDERWRTSLSCARAFDVDELDLQARPLSEPTFHRVDLDRDPCVAFPPTGLSSITAFFALRLSGRSGASERRVDVTVRLELDGAPAGRAEAVTAELLSDKERLLRFMMLLLADDGTSDRALGELEGLLTGEGNGGGSNKGRGDFGLPLLEPMLRALHRAPERLDEIERLIDDLRGAGAGSNLLPPELDELWQTIAAARERR